jgi:hypothetical protein
LQAAAAAAAAAAVPNVKRRVHHTGAPHTGQNSDWPLCWL